VPNAIVIALTIGIPPMSGIVPAFWNRVLDEK
jgi:hypothetical protein